jgi:hypothetical protein
LLGIVDNQDMRQLIFAPGGKISFRKQKSHKTTAGADE